mgnify:CR=1 FL=1
MASYVVCHKSGTLTNGNKGMRSCTHPMGICRCHVLTDTSNLRDSNASRTKRLSKRLLNICTPPPLFSGKLPYNFFPCLHMKNPFSAWNVNAKIGINMIKPETSGNKPMLHDIKNKIVQKRCARKREQDTRLPQSVKPPANHMAAWGARSPLR